MNKLKSFKNIYFILLLSLIVIHLQNDVYSQQKEQTDYIPVTFKSEDSKVYGRFFKTADNEPAPTVILLHGFPGREGDLFGFGNRLKKEGINAFTFSYRGAWKSEGILSPETSLQDVIKSIAFLKSQNISKKFNVDTTQIILLGYSYGSSMALLGSLAYSSVEKVISIGITDWSVFTALLETNEDFRKGHRVYLDKIMSDSTVVRSLGGKATHDWLFAHKDDYDLVKYSEELSNKKILLIGGWNDKKTAVENHTIPFYRALQKHNAKNLKIEIYDTDHSFRNVSEQLYQVVLDWIRK